MGKEQEVHKSRGLILKPYLAFFALAGLIIGFNIGFYLFSLAVILPLLVLILFVWPLRKRGLRDPYSFPTFFIAERRYSEGVIPVLLRKKRVK